MKVIYDSKGKRFYIDENNIAYPSVSTILSSASDYPFKTQYTKTGTPKKQNKLYANIGSVIHHHCLKKYDRDVMNELPSINEWVKNPDWVNEKIQNSYTMWCQFLTDFKPKFINVEQVIKYKNNNIRYMGRYDALAEINGKTVLIDLKTGNFYPYYQMQLSAYWASISPFPERAMIVRCDTHPDRNPNLNYQVYVYEAKELFEYFSEFVTTAEEYFRKNKV